MSRFIEQGGGDGFNFEQTHWTELKIDSANEVLTARQKDVLTQLAAGRTYKEAARELNVEYSTIRAHIQNSHPHRGIFIRLGAGNVVEAVLEAVDRGLINIDALYTEFNIGCFDRLTKREFEVCALMATGKTNKEIGYDLGITEKTVKTMNCSIFDKIGAVNRVDAALRFRKFQLTQIP